MFNSLKQEKILLVFGREASSCIAIFVILMAIASLKIHAVLAFGSICVTQDCISFSDLHLKPIGVCGFMHSCSQLLYSYKNRGLAFHGVYFLVFLLKNLAMQKNELITFFFLRFLGS